MKSLTAGGNEVKKLVLHDALILPDSHHNLISLGSLARDQHVGTWLAPGTGRSHLIFPDNVHGCGVWRPYFKWNTCHDW